MAKGERGGKYGKGTAGIEHELIEKGWGIKREFIGSATKTYLFYSADTDTILIVRADSYEDAKRLARSRGFKQYRSRKARRKR